MLILGIDTSGAEGTVALLDASGNAPRELGRRAMPGGRCSELLLPDIAELLKEQNAAQDAIGLLALANGPGSFTGLRVAVATAKGLAEAWGTPVAAVSVLEAVAAQAAARGRIMAVLDAHRHEVFFGEYEFAGDAPGRAIQESMVPLEAFAESFAGQKERPLLVTPDADVAAQLTTLGLSVQTVASPTAAEYAFLGLRHFRDGVRTDVAALDANYLRRSDAELFSAPRLGIPVK